ncbi:uncharacterized protein EI90DRAFT_525251 [Cantharellus anzutake]|uniref:uncharacterized protein n=1 Tax=Cantharellus anzutake TaxID=1750568 RepID=UPI001904174F|nr:uncharacterized protein EI90DRAFT_525251 [Cantharellus anzutake]KAF8334225.1 hypothetical protein EI90DRAFT_525251 [Cantharellus anzutake]
MRCRGERRNCSQTLISFSLFPFANSLHKSVPRRPSPSHKLSQEDDPRPPVESEHPQLIISSSLLIHYRNPRLLLHIAPRLIVMSSSSVPFYALDHWFRQRRALPAQRSAYAWARSHSVYGSSPSSSSEDLLELSAPMITKHDHSTPSYASATRASQMRLPYDVWRLFIHHLDFDSLRTVSCLKLVLTSTPPLLSFSPVVGRRSYKTSESRSDRR